MCRAPAMMPTSWAVDALRLANEDWTWVDIWMELTDVRVLKAGWNLLSIEWSFKETIQLKDDVENSLIVCVCLVMVQLSAIAGHVLNFDVISYQSVHQCISSSDIMSSQPGVRFHDPPVTEFTSMDVDESSQSRMSLGMFCFFWFQSIDLTWFRSIRWYIPWAGWWVRLWFWVVRWFGFVKCDSRYVFQFKCTYFTCANSSHISRSIISGSGRWTGPVRWPGLVSWSGGYPDFVWWCSGCTRFSYGWWDYSFNSMVTFHGISPVNESTPEAHPATPGVPGAPIPCRYIHIISCALLMLSPKLCQKLPNVNRPGRNSTMKHCVPWFRSSCQSDLMIKLKVSIQQLIIYLC